MFLKVSFSYGRWRADQWRPRSRAGSPTLCVANHSLFLDWKFLYDCIFLFICWFFRAVCQLPGPLVQAPDDTVTSDAHLPNASVPALDRRLYVVFRFARTQHTFRDSQSHSVPDKKICILAAVIFDTCLPTHVLPTCKQQQWYRLVLIHIFLVLRFDKECIGQVPLCESKVS